MSWPWWAVALAVAPVLVLAVLVLRSQPVTRSAWLAAAVALVTAVVAFGLDLAEAAVAVTRGMWTGAWILLIVLPALLLYEVLHQSGALDHLAAAADELAPTEGRRLLLLAFVLPSFLQGVAGFGAPIAMSAPMLIRRGMAPVAAVAACLIGYQWSVTFGGMGSSYFMAAATARLGDEDARSLALRAGAMLAITAVASGFLVLTRGEKAAGDRWRALVIGSVMGGVLLAVVAVQPALGSTTAGLAGLATCWWILPGRGGVRPRSSDLGVAASPYIVLTIAAGIGFAVPPVRAAFERIPELAPVLPGVDAAFGYATTASAVTPVFRPLLHPLPYLLLALVAALVAYRRSGWWTTGSTAATLAGWRTRARKVSASIIGLTILAAILTEAGMVAAVARALASTLGMAFVAVSAPLGTFGTILTGSTTASNALFSSLQSDVAVALSIVPAILIAGQTAGGNIGNSLSPTVAAVGTAAAGATGQEGDILRRNLGGAAILAGIVLVAVAVQVWVLT